ncbi:MAG: M23 family metallopeptidase [Minisyncoccia bacterium]|jgi:murein DD-endopeptidase MepM/ murein hydrolase activator NlpD
MKNQIRNFIFLALFLGILSAGRVSASAPQVIFSNPLLFQGDTLMGTISYDNAVPISASFDNRDIPVLKYQGSYRIVAGIKDIEQIGYHTISVKFADGATFTKKIYLRARKFPVVDLGVPEKLGLTPTQLTQNLEVEQSNLSSIVGVKTSNIFFSRGFGLALAKNDKIIGPYGEIRKTGNQTTRHLGIDFGSPKGSAVAAINGGIVREAENDPIYGNTVIVDHGEGIFSLYMHLDTILAKVGQAVKYGQVIGTVGETGYATGPHLHLSVKINGISVDPIRFTKIFN